MKHIFILITIILTSIFSYSQATSDTSDKEVTMSEVSVAATKFPENTSKVPQQVQVFNAKKIQFLNQQTAAELLTHTGNVLVQKSQLGGGSPIIRGFEANKVLIVVDGIRMNNAIFRGGHLQNVITMDNTILDKMEILFGPSSVMYGSDALGGVMSFYTKTPTFATNDKKENVSGNAFVRYASAYNEKTGHIDLSYGSNKVAYLTSFTYSDFGDLTQGSNYYSKFPNWGKRSFYVERINGVDSQIVNSNPNKLKQTGYKQYDFLQKIMFNTGKVNNVLNFQYSTSSNIFRYDRLTETTSAGVAKSAQWYYGPQKRLLAAWHMNLPKLTWFDKGQITTAFQNIEESRHNRNFKAAKLNHRIEKVDVISWNADFKKSKGKSEYGYGSEITYNKVRSSAYFDNITNGQFGALDTRYPSGGSNTQSYAVYANMIHKFDDKLNWVGGLRYSYSRLFSKFSDKTFFPFPFDDITQKAGALTWNTGLVVTPKGGWIGNILFSTGFRTPNVDDMTKVFESTSSSLLIPNPNLKPEKTYNFEIGLSKTFINKYRVGITAWYTNYKNALTTDFSSFNGSSQIPYNSGLATVKTVVNAAKAYNKGISANAAGDINEHISFSSTINYTYGRIVEAAGNYPLDHVAPLFGRTGITGKWDAFKIEAFALYNGKKDSADYNLRGEDNQIYSADVVRGFTPSWITANLRASYDFNKNFTVQVAAENILDKYYRVFASGLSAPGRNFVITLRGRF